ncbi:MAG: OB-fold putative lipoprotein [Bacteroidales bacterium]|nr:OB-fold putative lipoprotein [Bacteroidales bacterium]MCF8387737.1 OB-fold putative lipoprotein [Bacteroidales bacterium]MCF8397553.1 OB-fold putative lipoprotein [Bacteroidales bacterium]
MKKALKIIGILVIVGIIAAYGVYEFVINKSHPDYEKLQAEYSMQVVELYNQFQDDEDAAGQKYNGKMIQLEGTMNKVESSDSLLTAVFVFNKGMFGDEGVRISMLPSQHENLKEIELPADVKMKAYCIGSTDSDVVLKKGSIVQH